MYPIQLSGGQRQRILIVKSLLWSPKFLIMDEPVSSLDPYVQIEIIDIIKKLKIERNLTLLLISHDINFIKKICERVCILENGQIIEDGDVEEIINFPKHKSCNLCRFFLEFKIAKSKPATCFFSFVV